jgi:predicted amidohydrolase
MPPEDLVLRQSRRLAVEDPAQALALLWRHLGRHGNLGRGFDRQRLEEDADQAHTALERGDDPGRVHPASLLRAVDRFLAGSDTGQQAWSRKVILPGGEVFVVVPRRGGWSSRLARTQPNQREFWMRRHQVVPASHEGISVRVRRPPQLLAEALAGPELAYATGGFLDAVLPEWISVAPYICQRLGDGEARWASVQALLREASGRNATVLVLPELTIDAEVRARLRAWLRDTVDHPLRLVVAGSFHEDDSGEEEGAGPRRNVSRAFDRRGDEVLRHVKLQPMRTTEGEEHEVDEGVEEGLRLELLETPFGLLGVAICLDLCEAGDCPVTHLWQAVGPALLLVPSMGKESTHNAHRRKVQTLTLQHDTVVLVASQHPEESRASGLCLRDIPGLEEAPVLYGRIRWTRD